MEMFPNSWGVTWEELPQPPIIKWRIRHRTYGCCPRSTGRKFRCCTTCCGVTLWLIVVASFIGMMSPAMTVGFFPSSAEVRTSWTSPSPRRGATLVGD